MRKLEDSVVAVYMAISLFVVCLIVCLLQSGLPAFWMKFSWLDWIVLLAISVGTVVSQTLRFKAL